MFTLLRRKYVPLGILLLCIGLLIGYCVYQPIPVTTIPATTPSPTHTNVSVTQGQARLYVISTNDNDRFLSVYEPIRGATLYRLTFAEPNIYKSNLINAQLSPDGRFVYLSDSDSIRAFRAADGVPLWKRFIPSQDSARGSNLRYISQDASRLYVALLPFKSDANNPNTYQIKILDAKTGEQASNTPDYIDDCPNILAETSSGLLICFIDKNEKGALGARTALELRDPENGKVVEKLDYAGSFCDTALSPHHSLLLFLECKQTDTAYPYPETSSSSTTIRLIPFDLQQQHLGQPIELDSVEIHDPKNLSMMFDSNGQSLFIGNQASHVLTQYDIHSWKELNHWSTNIVLQDDRWCLSPDHMLIGEGDSQILRYQAYTQPLRPLQDQSRLDEYDRDSYQKLFIGLSPAILEPHTEAHVQSPLALSDKMTLAWLAIPITDNGSANEVLWRSGIAENIFPTEIRSISGAGRQTILAKDAHALLIRSNQAPLILTQSPSNQPDTLAEPAHISINTTHKARLLSPDGKRIAVLVSAPTMHVQDPFVNDSSFETIQVSNLADGTSRLLDFSDSYSSSYILSLLAWTDSGIYGMSQGHEGWERAIWRIDPDTVGAKRQYMLGYGVDGAPPGTYALNPSVPLIAYDGSHDSICTAVLRNPLTDQETIIEQADQGCFWDFSIAPDGRKLVYMHYPQKNSMLTDIRLYDIANNLLMIINQPIRHDPLPKDPGLGYWLTNYISPMTPFFWSPDSSIFAMLTYDVRYPLEKQQRLLIFRSTDGLLLDNIPIPEGTGSIRLNNHGQVLMISYQGQEAALIVCEIGTGRQTQAMSLGYEPALIVYTP